jgi:hypothetical protein
VNEELHNVLSQVLPSIVISSDAIKLESQTVANAFAQSPNLKINVNPVSPNEIPHVKPGEQKVDARAELLKKMVKVKEEAEQKK